MRLGRSLASRRIWCSGPPTVCRRSQSGPGAACRSQPGTGRQRFGDCLAQTQARRGVRGPPASWAQLAAASPRTVPPTTTTSSRAAITLVPSTRRQVETSSTTKQRKHGPIQKRVTGAAIGATRAFRGYRILPPRSDSTTSKRGVTEPLTGLLNYCQPQNIDSSPTRALHVGPPRHTPSAPHALE